MHKFKSPKLRNDMMLKIQKREFQVGRKSYVEERGCNPKIFYFRTPPLPTTQGLYFLRRYTLDYYHSLPITSNLFNFENLKFYKFSFPKTAIIQTITNNTTSYDLSTKLSTFPTTFIFTPFSPNTSKINSLFFSFT